MTTDDDKTTGFSLRRWSRRKLEAARTEATATLPAGSTGAVAPAPQAAATAAPASTQAPAAAAAAAPPDTLPPVETLGFDADFTAYLQPKVDESLKRQALKRMFQDPHFNVMDGLDVYIDDYSIEDPIPPEMLARLLKNRYLFDPPKTRVNAQGYVEDVPPDEEATAATPGDDAAGSDAAVESTHALPEPSAPPDAVTPTVDTESEFAVPAGASVARPDDQETPAR